MLKKITIKMTIALVGMWIALSGCEKSELIGYTGQNTVGFWIHTINHSLFGYTTAEMPRDTAILDLAITGNVVDYDRTVEGYFIPDPAGTPEKDLKNTATEGVNYNILGGVVKANEQYGKFKVEIINNDILKDGELKLNLAIKPNQDFEEGLKENQSIVITWSQKIMKPVTWKAMRFFFCSTYSTQVYKIFMQATGLKEFYYYEGIISEEEGIVMGRNFGNIIRAYEKEHGKPMLHDDGPSVGLPIIPIE